MEVIDANAVLLAFSAGPLQSLARTVLQHPAGWITPDIFMGECANVLTRLVRVRHIQEKVARNALAAIGGLASDVVVTQRLVPLAFERSLTINHGVFDCLYLEVARLRGTRLVTADARLASKLAGTADAALIVHLADWRP